MRIIFTPRSPGGTPIRQQPRECEVNDLSGMMARALKRKFQQTYTSPMTTPSPVKSPWGSASNKENSFVSPRIRKTINTHSATPVSMYRTCILWKL